MNYIRSHSKAEENSGIIILWLTRQDVAFGRPEF